MNRKREELKPRLTALQGTQPARSMPHLHNRCGGVQRAPTINNPVAPPPSLLVNSAFLPPMAVGGLYILVGGGILLFLSPPLDERIFGS